MSKMAARVSGFGTTIFTEMTTLANQHNAINLGQGFPDFAAPDFLKEAAQEAVAADINQYAPGSGRFRLREALAKKMADHYNRHLDPNAHILVVHGATEAIFATILALVNPGEEVVIFEPFYDSYVPSIVMAGGIPRAYTLRPPYWHIDRDELEALFNHKTKAVIINSPHNPTGKVYSQTELSMIAELCQAYDVIAITDDVYEHILFDARSHIPFAALPDMAERTVTISSLGKTFSVTGWKIGWVMASEALTEAIFRAHQFITFSGAAPLQEAAAAAIETAVSYYDELAVLYQHKRDYLVSVLQNVGLTPILPGGTYFTMVDISQLGFANDVAFCRYLTTEIGVTAIPPSAFYTNPQDGANLARFAFCKTEETLQQAAARLQKLTRG